MLALLLTGCRLGVVTDVEVGSDGRGEVAVVLDLDEELLGELDAIGVDPTAELMTAAAEDTGEWTIERSFQEGVGMRLTLAREVDEPAGFGAALRELTAGLSADDPGPVVDLEVTVADDGAARVDGNAEFRPPATAGATLDGEPIGPSGAELAALTADAVTSRVVVTFPGPIESSDADTVDGRTATWELEVGMPRALTAVAAAPSPFAGLLVPGLIVAGLAIVVAGGAVALVRRRR